jgi:amidase
MIDVEGYKTTAGCEALSRYGKAATADARCLRGFREAGIRLYGKTNLHELAFGTTGINSWTGTPINPLGADLIPGGSSSGNAVALALGLCDMAIGTDTGGSVRIPSACCGTAGLKTTEGRVSNHGVRPLAPTLDVVGPMARDVAGLARSMRLLDPTFEIGPSAGVVYHLEVGPVDQQVRLAIQAAIRAAGLNDIPCPISESEWEYAIDAVNDILWAEAAQANLGLVSHWKELQSGVSLSKGLTIWRDSDRMRRAVRFRAHWKDRLRNLLGDTGVILSPTIECMPPSFSRVRSERIRLARFTSPVNLAGLPALAIPIPSSTMLPSSLQLVGPPNGESMLLATAGLIEAAIGR